MKNTAALLDSIIAAIAAVVPQGQVNADDTFAPIASDPPQINAGRDVRVTAVPGRQRFPGKNLSDWETVVTLKVVYPDVATEPGSATSHQKALIDSEDILAALYIWSGRGDGNRAGVTKLEADLGTVSDDPGGFVVSLRTIRVEYTRD